MKRGNTPEIKTHRGWATFTVCGLLPLKFDFVTLWTFSLSWYTAHVTASGGYKANVGIYNHDKSVYRISSGRSQSQQKLSESYKYYKWNIRTGSSKMNDIFRIYQYTTKNIQSNTYSKENSFSKRIWRMSNKNFLYLKVYRYMTYSKDRLFKGHVCRVSTRCLLNRLLTA